MHALVTRFRGMGGASCDQIPVKGGLSWPICGLSPCQWGFVVPSAVLAFGGVLPMETSHSPPQAQPATVLTRHLGPFTADPARWGGARACPW